MSSKRVARLGTHSRVDWDQILFGRARAPARAHTRVGPRSALGATLAAVVFQSMQAAPTLFDKDHSPVLALPHRLSSLHV